MSSRVRALSTFLLSDLLGSVVRFPFWWYTEGLMNVARWAGRSLAYRWRGYAITLWARNFFTPMYGAHDWASRVISIIMRMLVITARFIALMVESFVYGLILFGWLALPVVCILFFLLNLSLGMQTWLQAF